MQDFKHLSKQCYKHDSCHPSLSENIVAGFLGGAFLTGVIFFALIQATGGL